MRKNTRFLIFHDEKREENRHPCFNVGQPKWLSWDADGNIAPSLSPSYTGGTARVLECGQHWLHYHNNGNWITLIDRIRCTTSSCGGIVWAYWHNILKPQQDNIQNGLPICYADFRYAMLIVAVNVLWWLSMVADWYAIIAVDMLIMIVVDMIWWFSIYMYYDGCLYAMMVIDMIWWLSISCNNGYLSIS